MKFSIDVDRFFALRAKSNALNASYDEAYERFREKRAEIGAKEAHRGKLAADGFGKTATFRVVENELVKLRRELAAIRAEMDFNAPPRAALNGLLSECRDVCKRRVRRFAEMDV